MSQFFGKKTERLESLRETINNFNLIKKLSKMKKEHLLRLLKVQAELSRLLIAFQNLGFDELHDRKEILAVVIDVLSSDEQRAQYQTPLFMHFNDTVFTGDLEDTDDNVKTYLNWLIKKLYQP